MCRSALGYSATNMTMLTLDGFWPVASITEESSQRTSLAPFMRHPPPAATIKWFQLVTFHLGRYTTRVTIR